MKACRQRRVRSAASPETRVRPAAVARARRLLADPGYPPPAVLRAVARQLAGRFAAERAAGSSSSRAAT